MSTTFRIDTQKKIVYIRRFGSVEPGELIDCMKEIVSYADFKEVDKLLSNVKGCDLSNVSSEELTEHAQFCKHNLDHLKVVVVADKDLSFGISRMFEMLSELKNIMIVREMSEGLKWLDLEDVPDDYL
jgi:hypothetical protein